MSNENLYNASCMLCIITSGSIIICVTAMHMNTYVKILEIILMVLVDLYYELLNKL